MYMLDGMMISLCRRLVVQISAGVA